MKRLRAVIAWLAAPERVLLTGLMAIFAGLALIDFISRT